MKALGALRAERGLPPVRRTPGLSEAVRVGDAAFRYLELALAHLILSRRVTTGRYAPIAAKSVMHEWIDTFGLDELDEKADALVAEARRCGRPA